MNEKLIKALSEIYDLTRIPKVGAQECIAMRGKIKAIARLALEHVHAPTAALAIARPDEPTMVMSDAQFYSEYED